MCIIFFLSFSLGLLTSQSLLSALINAGQKNFLVASLVGRAMIISGKQLA